MKRQKTYKIIGLLIITGLISCNGIKIDNNTEYIGNFQEYQYDFFESFQNTTNKDYYYELPFELKFGGIRPFPFDTIGKPEYSWLRNPKNLIIAFNTAKLIGLDKFVSVEQFNKPNTEWCCNTQWENKSLNEIVKGFINSDTTIAGNDYYSKFWQRRSKEGNLSETYHILIQIDKYYNGVNIDNSIGVSNPVLKNLLDFDLQLINADSTEYLKTSLKYFDYLKSVNLDYSAYKLTLHNERLKLTKEIKDSLLRTINHDTISKENWNKMSDNFDGWITWELYPDPNRYYGP